MRLTILVVISVISSTVMSQDQFEIWLDSSLDENPRDMIMNSDGDFLGIIRKGSEPFVYDCYLYKISAVGDTTSLEYVKQDTVLHLDKVIQVNKTPVEYLICGNGYPENGNPNHWFSYFAKIDNNMDIIWEKIYHLHDVHDYYHHPMYSQLLKKTDGTYLHANALLSKWQLFLFEFDDQGDSLNYRLYEGDSAGIVTGLTYNYDSTAYWLHISGGQFEPNPTGCECVEINFQLEYVKFMAYPQYFDFDYTPKLLPPNNIVAASTYGNPWLSEEYIGAIKLDSVFNQIGLSTLTSPDTANQRGLKSLDFFYPSHIYFAGTHNYQPGIWVPGPSWIVIGRLNENFQLTDEIYIGGDAAYNFKTVTATADSGVLVTTTWYDYDSQSYERDILIIKLSKDDLITGDLSNKDLPVANTIIYPNPGMADLNIRTTRLDSYFTLYDSNGNLILKNSINQKITNINTQNLSAGNYYWTMVKDGKVIESGTWLKSN